MPHDLRPLRLLGVLLAALQLTLPGAAMVVEAHLARQTEPVAHVEGYDAHCPYPGHPDLCAVCQFLRTPAAEASPSITLPQAPARRSAQVETPERRHGRAVAFFPLPRSPPSRG